MLLAGKPETAVQDAALAAMGLRLEGRERLEDFPVWPCVMPALTLFSCLQTQWIVGPRGAVGLQYASVEPVLRMRRVPRAEWPFLFDDLRTAEGAALDWYEERSTTTTVN